MHIIRAFIAALADMFAAFTNVATHHRNQAYGPRWSRHRQRRIDSYRRRRPRRGDLPVMNSRGACWLAAFVVPRRMLRYAGQLLSGFGTCRALERNEVMGKSNKSGLRRAFGLDELGIIIPPSKISNIKLSRIEHAKDRGGCTLCYPHGPETTNSTDRKNKRSWKHYRRTQYRVKDL
jgi:hypothetical protein